ncbi:MAG: serine acetyltransferase, partial [Lachnospiraceae bacterium]|nr:serine acetyltransferase [Lachnospiraceae bacterium]
MSGLVKEEEINKILQDIYKDYDGGKNIDAINIFNNPDKAEVRELVNNLFRIIYPGYFRDRSYKIYNPKYSFAVNAEDIFYHLNKQ